MAKFGAYHWKDPRAYKGFKTDTYVKSRPSNYTRRFKKLFPKATSLKQKAKATGVPLKYIKESYNRGMAAWRTGHRPGATEQQWGYARVHSFLLKGKTYKTTNSDLSRKAKAASASARAWWAYISGRGRGREGGGGGAELAQLSAGRGKGPGSSSLAAEMANLVDLAPRVANMSIPFLQLIPYDCSTLTKIRLGKDGDGGYVIPTEVISPTQTLITFGVCDEDSFEQAFVTLNPVPCYLCDPFVPYTKKNKMIALSLGLAPKTGGSMISFKDFLSLIQHKEENIFLKIDIEGAEWDIFESIEKESLKHVICLTIEFHDLLVKELLWPKINISLNKINELFHLYHIHGNNNGQIAIIDETILPDVIECTYISKMWAEKQGHTFTRRTTPFPDRINQKNYDGRDEIPISWFYGL